MKRLAKTALGLLGLALGPALTPAAASPATIRPQSIIVNPVPNDLQVNVWVDRGGDNPVYRIGAPIRLSVSVNQDAYVYLFSVHSDGNIDLILPNDYSGGENFLRAGETRSFPGSGARYTFTVGGPAGQDRVLALASDRQLDMSEIYDFENGQGFATVTVQGQTNLARALSIVVNPVPAQDWTTATAYFRVSY